MVEHFGEHEGFWKIQYVIISKVLMKRKEAGRLFLLISLKNTQTSVS